MIPKTKSPFNVILAESYLRLKGPAWRIWWLLVQLAYWKHLAAPSPSRHVGESTVAAKLESVFGLSVEEDPLTL